MADPRPILGLPSLDEELATVLPPGWLGLLLGRSGSGMPLFAKQFAAATAGAMPVRYYTTYERTEDVLRAFQDFGWSSKGITVVNLSDEYYERVLKRDLEVSQARERGLSYRDVERAPPAAVKRRTYNLANRLLSDLSTVEGPFRLVVDSLDFFLEVLEPAEVMMVARQIRHLAQTQGGEAFLVIQAEIHERRTTGLLEDLADIVIELRAEPRPDTYEHVFAIRKVRNHPEHTRIAIARATEHGLVLPPAPPSH